MMIVLAFAAASVFLAGLYQWARGGASLWRIFRLRHTQRGATRDERAKNEREIRELEREADRTISASFRIIAVLAVAVWVFLGVSVVLGMFGVDIVGKLSYHARAYWSQPAVQNSNSPVQQRNDMLRNMGNNLRR